MSGVSDGPHLLDHQPVTQSEIVAVRRLITREPDSDLLASMLGVSES